MNGATTLVDAPSRLRKNTPSPEPITLTVPLSPKEMASLIDQAAEQDKAPLAIVETRLEKQDWQDFPVAVLIDDEATRAYAAWRTVRFALAGVLAALVDREGNYPTLAEKLGAALKPGEMADLIEVFAGEKRLAPLMMRDARELAQAWETIESGVCAEHPEGFERCCQTLFLGLLDVQIALRKEVAA